ncbi:MAG: hypothetical protein QM731_18465 [Chitinophagaceae bacterium]
MRKIKDLGTPLSKQQQKTILGGLYVSEADAASCTVKCTCAHYIVKATCPAGTSTCSATDESGATCDGVEYSCTTICREY